jgi:hypothetical protein
MRFAIAVHHILAPLAFSRAARAGDERGAGCHGLPRAGAWHTV